MDRESAIVARASAPGRGVRALLRLSGPPTFALLRACGPLEAAPVRGGRTWRMFGRVPCLLTIMPGPSSFTGDDCAEIALAGNPDLVAEVESRLLAADATVRRAAPGEFTWRAFVNGRIDLTQAEGVAATIAASTDAELRAARTLVEGGLGRFVRDIAERVADDLALVEAGIDFTDQEDVVAISAAALATDLTSMIAALQSRVDRTVPTERLDAVPRVVLAGAPNAGKSTLFNALVGRTRTVVSSVAGTTRDAIAERLSVSTLTGAMEIVLVDIAGLDCVESGPRGEHDVAMQRAARHAIETADLVVRCVGPESEAPDVSSREIVVYTKVDLARRDGLGVCATTGAGLDALRQTIGTRLAARLVGGEGETLILGERHRSLLIEAIGHLERGLTTREAELVAANLRLTLDALGGITGAIAPDEVLGRIFGKFCVGK
ncbi:MAG: GTPase [Phycisphaerae bacterium]|nr:GTPase [Phycisphaerae bacterium]